MFDEPSLGLAPTVVHDVLKVIRDLNTAGMTCVLVEQNVAVSLKIAQSRRMFLKMAASRLLAPAPLSSRMSACDRLTLASSGADLTFATRLAAGSRSECQIQNSTYITGGPRF